MASQDLIVGSAIFFIVLNTITLALRVFVRTTLSKGALGWDDIFLLVTYVGFIFYAAFGFETMHYGFLSIDSKPWYDTSKGISYNLATNDVCYIISGTVKISVALVLYRLVERVYSTIRWILIVDIISCAVFNTVTTMILALGCMEGTPYTFKDRICQSTNYAQGASYIIWDMFHVILPVLILWNVQMSRAVKVGVAGLFAIGLLAAIATMFRLHNYVEYSHSSTMSMSQFWYTDLICGVTEHGLSLFASSILALKPLVGLAFRSWTRLLSSLDSSKRLSGGESTSGRGVFRRWDRTYVPLEAELQTDSKGTSTRKDVFVAGRTYVGAGQGSQTPIYTSPGDESFESHRCLVSSQTGRERNSEAA